MSGNDFKISPLDHQRIFREGPYTDIFEKKSIDAKRDPRLKESGAPYKVPVFWNGLGLAASNGFL